VFARTDPAKRPGGISALIIEKDTPGFSFGTQEDKFGLRADPTRELVFEDCRIPKENLVGQEGDAMRSSRLLEVCISLARPPDPAMFFGGILGLWGVLCF